MSLSPRDSACLSTILGLTGPDGWVSAPRGRLLERSGLTWTTWRRAVGSLVVAGLLEERPGTPGAAAVSSSFRATDLGRAAQVGPGAAQVSGPGRPTSFKTPDALLSAALKREREEQEHPEELGRAAQGAAQVGPAPPTDELAASIRYLGDQIGEALAQLALALIDSRAHQGQRPAPVPSQAKPAPDLGHKDRRGWTGRDLEGQACPLDAAHGHMRPAFNRSDDSWFARCPAEGCPGKADPAVARRQATPPDPRPATPARPKVDPVDVGALLGSLSGSPLSKPARSARRDPRSDPRPGDVLEAGNVSRKVTLRTPERVGWDVLRMHGESHSCTIDHWARWARQAEVRAWALVQGEAG